jgi:phosphoribosylformylglycinamidine synthase
MVAAPNLCDKSWVTDQYDRYVRGNSVLAQPEDAGMLRIDEETSLGIALATDGNGRFCLLDPYVGPSWPWPRRTGTSPSAGPSRWPSPTA